jgi:hypothetical protein
MEVYQQKLLQLPKRMRGQILRGYTLIQKFSLHSLNLEFLNGDVPNAIRDHLRASNPTPGSVSRDAKDASIHKEGGVRWVKLLMLYWKVCTASVAAF